ncbi:hypothetical protein PHSY_003454 [Pseudozyma hubeiensis SY62]|uniref:Uncharacterized protein n=1 Tax=Pseudozyma hubeiensis (strain SY62) TaxID=1305764 RepID=R9P3G0_PSEHS|nr:hypothetical protein PHSY_003454 [Pseudozyma hubeiensis SY62]GAC95876.1 hypothetical protein PHSY_003454 [Pseudozyma hubeiensis SY62]
MYVQTVSVAVSAILTSSLVQNRTSSRIWNQWELDSAPFLSAGSRGPRMSSSRQPCQADRYPSFFEYDASRANPQLHRYVPYQ